MFGVRLLGPGITLLAAAVTIGCTLPGHGRTISVVSVEGGRLQGRASDGSPLPPTAILGHELTILDETDEAIRVRIDDEAALHGMVAAYEVSRLDAGSGRWMPYCEPDREGRRAAVALPGRWRDRGAGPFVEDPHVFTLTCTGGSNGKCARLGYVPGARTRDGESLTPYFEACVRMMRADYCGDGGTYTEAGVAVEHDDRHGRPSHHHALPLAFEAVWGPRGAICVRRPRLPHRVSLPQLAASCPRLADAVGERCREDLLATRPDALFASRSPEPT